MAIPLEIGIREAYAAFGRGDIEGYFSVCTEEFSFNVPGRGALAGMYCGKSGIHELARKAIEISSASFCEEVEDVLVSDRYVVVLAGQHLARNGQPKEYQTVHVYRLEEGKLAECCEHPRDQALFEEAWGVISTP